MSISFYDSMPDLGPCIEWPAGKDKDGYGFISITGSKKRVARYLYFLYHPETDPELTIDHLCRNRACFSLYHLDAISREENTQRALATGVCGKCGTPLKRSDRSCVNCHREYMRLYMRKKYANGYIAPSRRK
jgi:hypothetical protein